VGPRAGLDRWENLAPTGVQSPERPARSQSLYRLRYPAHPFYYLKITNVTQRPHLNATPDINAQFTAGDLTLFYAMHPF
jgi:hypothetical protein